MMVFLGKAGGTAICKPVFVSAHKIPAYLEQTTVRSAIDVPAETVRRANATC
jgi:hypothetical protein